MALCEVRYFSNALEKQTSVFAILPDPSVPGPYRVMFLLHGLSDDHSIWLRRTSIERYVDGLPLIVVMPDGGRGFYCDAIEGYAYATALGDELPTLVEHWFSTRPGWCVSGLSMGGYGAFRLALDHPDRFLSATSHSGALLFGHHPFRDLSQPTTREFARIVGPEPAGGANDLLDLVLRAEPLPALRFDCGQEDFLLEANRAFRDHLVANEVPHEYEEFPGSHEWSYWDEHIRESLSFHRRNLGI
ncbi:MAG: esterase family protein [Fimbriimonadaceae bacterium]|nr:esterase family protein [Fimbriimonadaceae bacterium]